MRASEIAIVKLLAEYPDSLTVDQIASRINYDRGYVWSRLALLLRQGMVIRTHYRGRGKSSKYQITWVGKVEARRYEH